MGQGTVDRRVRTAPSSRFHCPSLSELGRSQLLPYVICLNWTVESIWSDSSLVQSESIDLRWMSPFEGRCLLRCTDEQTLRSMPWSTAYSGSDSVDQCEEDQSSSTEARGQADRDNLQVRSYSPNTICWLFSLNRARVASGSNRDESNRHGTSVRVVSVRCEAYAPYVETDYSSVLIAFEVSIVSTDQPDLFLFFLCRSFDRLPPTFKSIWTRERQISQSSNRGWLK